MSTTDTLAWAVRTRSAVSDQATLIGSARVAAHRQRHEAMVEALAWASGWSPGAPISGVRWPADAASVRVECDAALLVALYHHAPTPGQWAWLGHPNPPRIAPGDTAEWGYGVWRVLAWMLGDIDAPPPTEDVTRWPSALPDRQQAEVASAAELLAQRVRG